MNSPRKNSIKILIVDDHELSRNGLLFGFLEEEHLVVVGQAENGEEAIIATQTTHPDVILMDIAMPVLDGVEATQSIKELFPGTKVIMLTSRQEEDEIYAALAAGADAYCMKDVSSERLINIIQMVVGGGFWLDPAIAKLVLKSIKPKLSSSAQITSARQRYRVDLTEREQEVLELLVKGHNNKELADLLNVSVHTIKAHISSIMQKLAVDDRTEAAVKALKEGLVRQSLP